MSEEGATQPAPEKPSRHEPSKQQEHQGGPPRDRDRSRRRHQQNQPRRPEQEIPMPELRDLFVLFSEHGLTDFEFEREGFRVHLGRNLAPQIIHAAAPVPVVPEPQSPSMTSSSAASNAATQAAPIEESEEVSAEESLNLITSPIVGTFYRSPSPTAEPFVRLGSHVSPDTVVCIIEAMKLMNEIQAEASGEIAKIYVENGQPVEFGQPLFGIKK